MTEPRAFVEDPTSLQGDCAECGLNIPHPTPESPEPYTPPDFMPLLPEDGIDYMTTPCPVSYCRVTSGDCVSLAGHYRRPHPERLEKASAA